MTIASIDLGTVRWPRWSGALQIVLALISSPWNFSDLLKNQLANSHAFDQLDW
jgi:hypothetical protein